MTAAVECKDAALRRLKQHGIGVLSGRDGRENLVGCAIEDKDRAGSAVGDIAEFALIVEGDAVRVGEAGNLGDQLARLQIDEHDPVEPGDVEDVRCGIDSHVIPASISAQLPGVLELEGRFGGAEIQGHREGEREKSEDHSGS